MPTPTTTPAETVQQIYQAFGRGDVPAILATLAPDVAWEHWPELSAQRAGVPWLAPRRGADGVLGFFNIIGGFTFHDFQVLDLVADGRCVVAVVRVDFTVPSSGVRSLDEEIHFWRFDDQGRVAAFRHYCDTAKHIRAAGLELPA